MDTTMACLTIFTRNSEWAKVQVEDSTHLSNPSMKQDLMISLEV